MNKHTKLKIQAQAGVKQFSEDILIAKNFEEVKAITNKLLNIVYVYAPKANNRPNKGLKVFQKYLKEKELQAIRSNKIKQEINQTTKKTYKDYLSEIYMLRQQGKSNQTIANTLQQAYGIKVSRETIRKVLQNV